MTKSRIMFIACAAACAAAWAGAPVRADVGDNYDRLIKEKAPALVTVKYLLRMEGQFGKRESESEITGIMIDPKGLVLCANSRLGAPRRWGTATPTDVKVLIGDDIEGLESEILARDTELDLAWVRIKEPGDRTFDYLDLNNAAEPKIGDPLFTVRRMAKFFDRAATASDGRLSGRTGKPRDLLIPAGGMNLEQGQPVFTADGALVGIVVLQLPEDEEMEANPMAFMSMRNDILAGLILPAAQVQKATQRAREIAAEEDEEEDETDGETKGEAESDDASSATENGDQPG